MPRIFYSQFYRFIVHSVGVNEPTSQDAIKIIAGAVEYQSIANPCSGVVFMDVSAEPQFRLYFLDPYPYGTASAVTSVVENIPGSQGRCMRHHDAVSVCAKFAQFILQLIVVDLTISVEGCE